MDLGLKGKNALVTGGSHGIGLAIAIALAHEGVNVAICSRTQKRLIFSEALIKKKGVKTLAIPCDVFKLADIENVCGKIIEAWGALHILVNNVGGGGSWGSDDISKTDDKVWTEVFEKNALSAARFTSHLVPFMKNQKWGRVITITSKHGKEAGGRAWFTMAKSAEIALMKSLAIDPVLVRAGITFNSVAPGNIMIPETGWEKMKTERPEEFAAILEGTPRGIIGTPEDVAPLVVFLASEQAAHINGATIAVDGGETKSF